MTSHYMKVLIMSMHNKLIHDIINKKSKTSVNKGLSLYCKMPGNGDYMDKNFNELISEMTIEEKVNLLHGTALFHNGDIPRLNIPSLIMSDGPLGVRFDFEDNLWKRKNEELCQCSWLISGTALASTWNTELAYETGNILGAEARGRGKDIILAPGINIHRTPLCGRNFEYMSEDPYLTGMLAAKEIQGIQSNDVAACVKHFALNNQETDRMEVNVRVDERALYEIYLPAFEAALIYGNSYSVMCAYNRFRGDYASESRYLLTDILRKKWKYDGVVISDWSAVHSTEESFNAGVDIEMGVSYDFDNYFFAAPLLKAIKENKISNEVLDSKILRILKLLNKIKKIGNESRKTGAYNMPSSHETLLCAARESVVLLKNENNFLPLDVSKTKNIAVIGDAASRRLALGGGSSEIDALFEITPLLGISMLVGDSCKIHYAIGYYVDNEENTEGDVNWQADSLDAKTTSYNLSESIISKRKELLCEAVSLAKKCDAVIYVGGLNRSHDTEGFDRTSYELPYDQEYVISELINANKNIVVCINAGSAVNLAKFAQDVPAICYNSMNGMMGGLALAEILFGHTNPSGKLPVSFPVSLNDCPAKNMDGNYSEGIYVGYRYYETRKIKPLFCFGHGLSYTTFDYYNIKTEYIGTDTDDTYDNAPLYKVTCTVKNTGNRSGKETVQLYVTPMNNTPDRPVLELKGFTKINLLPKEEKNISFTLKTSSFAYYSIHDACYRADAGVYRINIGRSCEDIRLMADISLTKDYYSLRSQ